MCYPVSPANRLLHAWSGRVRSLLTRLLVACLPMSCTPSSTDLEQIQRENMQLIKQLHQRLNAGDWEGAARLYANPVDYKGAITHFAEVPYRPAQLMALYRNQELFQSPPGTKSFEITQLYPVYTHQVVAELRPWPGTRGICQIYTIERGRITRQYTY